MIPSWQRLLWIQISVMVVCCLCVSEAADIIAALTATSGKVSVLQGSKQQRSSALTGMALRAGDKLILGSKSSVLILFNNGIQKRIPGPSVYTVALPKDRPDLLEVGKRLWLAVSDKFRASFPGSRYAWRPPESAVVRGVSLVSPLTALAPRSSRVLLRQYTDQVPPEDVIFEWTSVLHRGTADYKIELKSEQSFPHLLTPQGLTTFKDPMGVNIVHAQLPAETFKPGHEYSWRVVSVLAQLTEYSDWTTFTVMTKEEWSTTSVTAKLQAGAPLALGAFYESQGCLSLARVQYLRGLKDKDMAASSCLLLADLYHSLKLPALAEAAMMQAETILQSKTGKVGSQ